jgi:hypothetical protein
MRIFLESSELPERLIRRVRFAKAISFIRLWLVTNPGVCPPTPTILDEYQNKGVTKFAFRKSLILRDAILVVSGLHQAEMAAQKRKAGASSRTRNPVIYKAKYSTN